MQRSFLARHVTALAGAALILDVLAVIAARSMVWSVVPGWHTLILSPYAMRRVMAVLALLAVVHVLLAVAVWQRLRHRRESLSRSPI